MSQEKPIVETIPVTEETQKVSEVELKQIQELNQVMQQITMAMGQSFISCFRMFKDFDAEKSKLTELSKTLEEIYGKVNININDGTVSPIPEEEQSEN